jgi:hypothetical protein
MNLRVRFAVVGFAALFLLTARAQDHLFSIKDDID